MVRKRHKNDGNALQEQEVQFTIKAGYHIIAVGSFVDYYSIKKTQHSSPQASRNLLSKLAIISSVKSVHLTYIFAYLL